VRQQNSYPANAGGGGQHTTMCNSCAPFSRTFPSLIVCLYSRLLKLKAASNSLQVVYKNRDYRQISGPSLLDVTCHQHLDEMDGMRPTALTIHALYTNAALPRIRGDLVYHRWCCKILPNIFLLIMDSPGAVTFLETLVELILSSNWYVMLRLTVFEIFAINWLSARPKLSKMSIFAPIWSCFGIPPPPQREKTSWKWIDLPSCKLSRQSVATIAPVPAATCDWLMQSRDNVTGVA